MKSNLHKKFIFAGYRSWAINVFDRISSMYDSRHFKFYSAESRESFRELISNEKDAIIILVGWSWILPKKITQERYVTCIHPSDLPEYSGGSPIQHQILDGLTSTKMTFFKVNSEIDKGDIISKTFLDISGGIPEIFKNMENASVKLISEFINNFPNIELVKQKDHKFSRKRLRPEDSKVELSELSKMNTKQIYDMMRCREDPYPNVYIEDEFGTLFFKKVSYKKKESKF